MNWITKIINYFRYGKKRDGLTDLTDDKNFGSRAVYKPTPEDLTEAKKQSFTVFDPKRLDQLDSDFCVGFGGAYEADATEHFTGESEQGSGAYNFAGAKKWSRQPLASFGTSLLAGAMARVTYGICNKELWDYKLFKRNFFANWNNIPQDVHDNAEQHKAGSAWELQIPWGMTKFNAILATLWHFKDKRVLIGTGDQAHRRTVFGYDKARDCLMSADTYGERTYEKGTQYITRDRARTLFTPYFVLDIERSLAELLVEYVDKVIKTADNNDCYLVKDGKKHSLVSEEVAWSNGYLLAPYDGNKLAETIDKKDLDKIPTGEPLKFQGGKYEWIVRRIYERNELPKIETP